MEDRTLKDSEIVYRQLVMPNDTNTHGTLFGGKMMSWIDVACALSAVKYCSNAVVTVHMDDVSFKEPVQLGDQVVIHCRVTHAGTTSMEVEARAYRENPMKGINKLCLTAFLTFVALDKDHKPTKVPKLVADKDEDAKVIEAANIRVKKRKQN